jgi:hypothetical protein
LTSKGTLGSLKKKKLPQVFSLENLKPNPPPMEVKALAPSVVVLARAKLWLFSWAIMPSRGALNGRSKYLASMVKIHQVDAAV